MDYKLTLLTEFKDNVSNKIKPVLSAVQKAKKHSKIKILTSLHDKVSPKMKVIQKGLQVLKNTKANIKVDAVNAKAKIEEIKGKLRGIKEKIIPTSVRDKASPILQGIKGKLMSLAAGVTFTAVAKVAIEGIGQEQTQKITINRVFENSGKTKQQAKKATDEYYKYLESYANKTPFSTASVAQFGTKAALISKGDMNQAKEITSLMGECIAPCYSNVA